jgi:hypothetical protein
MLVLPLGKNQVRGFAIRKYTCIMTIDNNGHTHELLVPTLANQESQLEQCP